MNVLLSSGGLCVVRSGVVAVFEVAILRFTSVLALPLNYLPYILKREL